jgi:mitogen-activated protein kinase organizer 1
LSICTFPPFSLTLHYTKADGKYCLTGASDRTVRLWNPTRIDPAYYQRPSSITQSRARDSLHSSTLPSALPMQTYSDGHIHPIYCLAANRSSTTLLSASDKTLLATDLLTAQNKQKWWGHAGRIEYVTCLGGSTNTDDDNKNNISSAMGEEIYASASYDSTVRLWDARSRSKDPLMILDDATDAVTCVTQSPSQSHHQIITSSVDGKTRTYDVRFASMIMEDIVHPITSISVSNDGMASMMAASCLDGCIRLWDRSTSNTTTAAAGIRKRIHQKLHSYHTCNKYKVECTFTSSDEYVLSGSECGAVVVYPVEFNYDLSSKSVRNNIRPSPQGKVLQRHQGPTCSIAACPQTARPWLIVSASYDGTAVVWTSEAQHDCCLVE